MKKEITLRLKFDDLNQGKAFDYRFRFFEFGSVKNPTLIFLHGNSSRAEEWFRTIGDQDKTPLHQNYHLLAVQLPGWGGKEGSDIFRDHDYSFDRRIVPTLITFADHLKQERFVVIGSSMGAYIAQVWALQDTRIEKLILFSPPGSTGNIAPGVPFFIHMGAGLYRYGRHFSPLMHATRFFTCMSLRWILSRSKFFEPTFIDLLVDNLKSRERYVASLSYAHMIHHMGTTKTYQPMVANVHERIGKIGKPVLHIWSEKDFIVPTFVSKKMSEMMGAKSIVVGSGHMSHLIDPQGAKKWILEFLNNKLPPEKSIRYLWKHQHYQPYP